MSEEEDKEARLEGTIARIAELPAEDEAGEEAQEAVPPADYADTVTGQKLADIVEKINVEHAELEAGHPSEPSPEPAAGEFDLSRLAEEAPEANPAPPPDAEPPAATAASAPEPGDHDDAAPGGPAAGPADESLPGAARGAGAPQDASHESSRGSSGEPGYEPGHEQGREPPGVDLIMDEIASVVRVMEDRLRARVEETLQTRQNAIEADYRTRMQQLRRVSRQEMQVREAALRRSYARKYDAKEQKLRSYYKKLIAMANKITRQKAQLQQARRQFETKLEAANRLYAEVDEMRSLLTENIKTLDRDTEEVPELPDEL